MFEAATRRRGVVLVLALGLMLAGAACGGTPVPASPEAHGLVVLEGGSLRSWLGDLQRPASVEIPGVSGASWIAASSEGRLVALAGSAVMNVADKLTARSSSPQPNWKVLDITDTGSHQVPGPYGFPTWDPSGTRLALLTLPVDGQPQIVVADASTGHAARSITLDGTDSPVRIAWVGADTLAVVMMTDTSPDPASRTILVDLATGAITDGPSRLPWVASPDASLVITNAPDRPGNGPFSVQTTESWLAGSDAALGVLPEPSDGGGYLSFAFDQAGQRVAFSWVSGKPDQVSEHIYAASVGWKDVAATPARERKDPVSITWVP